MALLERCAAPLRAHVSRNLDTKWRSVLDEDDVLQVTYMEAFDSICRLEPRGVSAFMSWLHRLADNNIRDAIRHLDAAKRPGPDQRVRPTREDDASLDLVESLGVHSTTPSRVAAAREASELLKSALGDLPPDHQEVVRRFDLAHEEPREIAATMGRSIGAVYMLRARAHDRLRRILPAISG
ncbi:MAG: sigma-70 family RNA polymerase sigma factor [Phycisphaerales bacterium]|nr:sigma-70 family RNA polymerase sigma factor [Phycisphaerales bacterium]MCB9864471.1 sigma-70 family RNA polymerase sigma factor [Phycisphaerales bacterium]